MVAPAAIVTQVSRHWLPSLIDMIYLLTTLVRLCMTVVRIMHSGRRSDHEDYSGNDFELHD